MANESKPDEAYFDRNQAVMLAARVAAMQGYTVGVKYDVVDPEWPILYIDLPTGQVSWHLPYREVVGVWPAYKGEWNGHDVESKRLVLRDFILRTA